jgi:purine-binding chemotaxis protein CheW
MSTSTPANPMVALVVFAVQGQRYALPLERVIRIVQAVDVTPLPGAPPLVHGIIDVAGEIMPVLSLRKRLGLPDHPIEAVDQFIIARMGGRLVALVADESRGIITVSSTSIVPSDRILPGLESFRGVAQMEDGLVLIHDLERFLDPGDNTALEQALKEEVSRAD